VERGFSLAAFLLVANAASAAADVDPGNQRGLAGAACESRSFG
jgi:hypothetical protein